MLHVSLPWDSIMDKKLFSVRILDISSCFVSFSVDGDKSEPFGCPSLCIIFIYFSISGRLMYLLPLILLNVIVYKLYFTPLEALRTFYLSIVLIFIIMKWFVVGFLSLKGI